METMSSGVYLVNIGSKRALNCHVLMKVMSLSGTNEEILERLQCYITRALLYYMCGPCLVLLTLAVNVLELPYRNESHAAVRHQ